ncbi:MAG: hypothetical protein COZ31_08400 [Nitrospirae bacterium CG_4_10_14_3_um_filter_44_29]|nr:MAG: hypothetical protein COZ31_08400 [Nitrospirae bacterium CG_4_10_14_3_um_filter_44_29]
MEPISFDFVFTPEAISALVGFALMLLFAYFPGLRTKFAVLASEIKSYIMIGLLTLSAVVIWILAINGIVVTSEPVTINTLLKIVLALLISNQPTYSIAPVLNDVKAAKEYRDFK